MTSQPHTVLAPVTGAASAAVSALARTDGTVESKVDPPGGTGRPASSARIQYPDAKHPKPSFIPKDFSLDSLTALNVFVRAAEACSFTDAGQHLGLSSSAVGKCVARLEQRLGVRLFHRNTRCINLTHEGMAFLESCRRIFFELRSVEQELAQTTGAPRGRLRVSMPLTGMLMVPTLGNFIRSYPEVELDFDFTDALVDVVDGGYDVVLRSGAVADCRLKSRRLGAYRFEIVGSPDYFERAGVPAKPEDLLVHACLHRRHPTTGKAQPWPFAQSAAISDCVLPPAAMASTFDALIHLAESGVGVACVPDFCVWRQIKGGTLVSILNGSIDRVEVVRAMWPSSQYPSPKLRVFLDFLAQNLSPTLSSMSNAHSSRAM